VIIVFLVSVNMTLCVKKSGGDDICVEVAVSETIDIVKKKINEVVGTAVDRQILCFDGHEMEDTCTLSDYKVKDKSTIDLVIGKGMCVYPNQTKRVNRCVCVCAHVNNYLIQY